MGIITALFGVRSSSWVAALYTGNQGGFKEIEVDSKEGVGEYTLNPLQRQFVAGVAVPDETAAIH